MGFDRLVSVRLDHVPRVMRICSVDVLAILLFALIGRLSHHEPLSPTGILMTAWPFLVGAGIGWVACRALDGKYADLRNARSGLVVALFAVFVGMCLRSATGQGTAPAFVIVAALTLALLLGVRRGVTDRLGVAAMRRAGESA